eukprot:gnl/TRDRNA2_/TRDRNA2_205489_c0_seq1.p1 gnl/TRDRNA2_/TRDRNA2_205489_c0~~gnl/TRDRNA2_/TRDRNA2_205489_c0_seq1.p1  ORF type:complete len:208 (-),score=32.81 gnl/TRDRNA2_/TRDRNA2_205489_c0_seq1:118-696(-)
MDAEVNEEALTACLQAAARALDIVQGRCDCHTDPASHNALYLRKEATRLIAAVCAAAPQLGSWVQMRGGHTVLVNALTATADGIADGSRDPQVEEALRLGLLALAHVVGPSASIVGALRRWGVTKPAVARAAADALVELMRCSLPPASVEALRADRCCEELVDALQAHAKDEELLGRLNLAMGFLGCQQEHP